MKEMKDGLEERLIGEARSLSTGFSVNLKEAIKVVPRLSAVITEDTITCLCCDK